MNIAQRQVERCLKISLTIWPRCCQSTYNKQNLQLSMETHQLSTTSRTRFCFVKGVHCHGRKIGFCWGVVHQPPRSCWFRQWKWTCCRKERARKAKEIRAKEGAKALVTKAKAKALAKGKEKASRGHMMHRRGSQKATVWKWCKSATHSILCNCKCHHRVWFSTVGLAPMQHSTLRPNHVEDAFMSRFTI